MQYFRNSAADQHLAPYSVNGEQFDRPTVKSFCGEDEGSLRRAGGAAFFKKQSLPLPSASSFFVFPLTHFGSRGHDAVDSQEAQSLDTVGLGNGGEKYAFAEDTHDLAGLEAVEVGAGLCGLSFKHREPSPVLSHNLI